MVFSYCRHEPPEPQFNTLTLWGMDVVRSRMHLIPGLFLSTLIAIPASQAEVTHSESWSKKKKLKSNQPKVIPIMAIIKGDPIMYNVQCTCWRFDYHTVLCYRDGCSCVCARAACHMLASCISTGY